MSNHTPEDGRRNPTSQPFIGESDKAIREEMARRMAKHGFEMPPPYEPKRDSGERRRRSDKVSNPVNQTRAHSHYFKDVSKLKEVDVYRICALFGVDDQSGATHHAIKKLLLSGKRGAKDQERDIREAIDTMNRRLQMIAEDCN